MNNFKEKTGFDDFDDIAEMTINFTYDNFKKIFDEQNKGNKVNVIFNFKGKDFKLHIEEDENSNIYNDERLILIEFHPMYSPNYFLDDEGDWYQRYLNDLDPHLEGQYRYYDGNREDFHDEFIGDPDWYDVCFEVSFKYWDDYYSQDDYSNIIETLKSIFDEW